MADKSTVDYYNLNANIFAEQTNDVEMLELYNAFIVKFSNQKQHILDVGCGSGRDAAYFAKQGYDVTAIDASVELIKWAKEHHSLPNINWLSLNFEDIYKKDLLNKFTAIWACASLLHVPYNELSNIISTLIAALSDDGIFYLSFKYGDRERIKDGRFFCDMNEERWAKIVDKINYPLKYQYWISQENRPDRKEYWLNILLTR